MSENDSVKVKNAILHILDNNLGLPILSNEELNKETEAWSFLEKHISKALNHNAIKNAVFIEEQNNVYNLIKNISDDTFKLTSINLSTIFFSIMKKYCDISPCDLVYCLFEKNSINYLAIMKFNYNSSFVHHVLNTEQGTINKLIKQKTTLPGVTQKLEECVFVNLSDFSIKIIEKQYDIDGDKDYYLSKYFIGCRNDLSINEKLNILNKTVNKICDKHIGENFKKVAQLQRVLSESVEEANEICVDMVADAVFEETELSKEYIEEVKKAGITENTISISHENSASKQFKKNKLKTDTGIEISFPSQHFNNKDVIDFINNPDGSISILIKNINKITNR